MDNALYSLIYKRKSVRRFDGTLSRAELDALMAQTAKVSPLVGGLKTEIKLIPVSDTSCKRGEYCLAIYGEESEHYLTNAGYIGEQLDLWMASQNIGACWYGMGKPKTEPPVGMKFIIMFYIGKARAGDYRADISGFNRKKISEIWVGELADTVGTAAHIAPSATNSQPWRVECSGGRLKVMRSPTLFSIMPTKIGAYMNSIDMGIFLCFLELTLAHEGIAFERTLTGGEVSGGLVSVAEYKL